MMVSRLLIGVVALWMGLVSTWAAASEYPEFVGVYLQDGGSYVALPEVKSSDRVVINELVPLRMAPSNQVRMVSQAIDGAFDVRFSVYPAAQVAAVPLLSGSFDGILVRSRFPSEEIFVEYLTDLSAFGTLQDPVAGSGGIAVRGSLGEYQDLSHLFVQAQCGYDQSNFNIKLVDETAVEFVPKSALNLTQSATIGQCGKSNSAKAKAILVVVGNKRYLFRLN